MNLSKNLQQVMQEKQVEMSQMSQWLNIDEKMLSYFFKGKYYPKRDDVLALADKLDITVDTLLPYQEALMHSDINTHWMLVMTFDKKDMAHCYYLDSFYYPTAKQNEPSYALYGVDTHMQEKMLLGYYKEKEALEKEIHALTQAIIGHEKSVYNLQFQSSVKKSIWGTKLI